MKPGDDDVVLKLVHTADWHLGMKFGGFSDEAAKKLKRARIDVLDNIFGEADRQGADAVLCAGDLFDTPDPDQVWWKALADKLNALPWSGVRKVFLLPGNHDPLLAKSVWAPDHPFRQALPAFVQVVDRPNFEAPLGDGAVLYAEPCGSLSSSQDPTHAIPHREPGDERIRVGMVHGMTFDMPDHVANFPVEKDAAQHRGLDYLALGDTHGFKNVASQGMPPMVYPSAPEPTKFGERDAGNIAVVLIKRSRKVRLEKVPVATWKWRRETIDGLDGLRRLAEENLKSTALDLTVTGFYTPDSYREAEGLLEAMKGNEASDGAVGAFRCDVTGMHLDPRNIEEVFAEQPEEIQLAARALKKKADQDTGAEAEVAERALLELCRLVREQVR